MTDKTAEELAADELELKKARGDIVDDDAAADDDGAQIASDAADAGDAGDDADDGKDSDDVLGAGADGGAGVDGDGDAADDEGLAADDGGDKDKGITIPKAVFDKRNQKAKEKLDAAEQRLADAEAKLKTQTTNADVDALQKEIDDLEDSYEDQMMEGELTKARSIRKDLRVKQRALSDTLLSNQAAATGSATVEQIRFETLLAAAEVKYPMLNPDGEEFDQDTANEVSELLSAFQANGFKAAAALNKALTYVMRAEDAAEPVKLDPKVKKTQRAAAARKTVAKAAKNSPPDLKDAGRDSDDGSSDDGLPDITKMSPEQFADLSASDLSKLRGDHLADGEGA